MSKKCKGKGVNCTLCRALYECWRRASEIVMKHYFGEEEDGKKKS